MAHDIDHALALLEKWKLVKGTVSKSFLDGRITLRKGDYWTCSRPWRNARFNSCVTDPPYHLTSIVKRFSEMGPNDKKLTMGRVNPFQRTAVGFINQKWDGGELRSGLRHGPRFIACSSPADT